jgi:hypothetical protein
MFAVALIASSPAAAQSDFLFLGAQSNVPEFQFRGTGTDVIDIFLQDCSGGTCIMASGSASGMGTLFSTDGKYSLTTTSSTPFTLVPSGGGNFTVIQTTPINFSFSASQGTLTGLATFTSAPSGGNMLTGTLTVTGGTFASEFPSGVGSLSVNLANGFDLNTLIGNLGIIDSEIDQGMIVPEAVPPSNVCPLTQGFWKNHPSAWPVTSLEIGGVTLTEAQLIDILETPPKGGNAVLILEHQLIATLLNIANGSNSTPILSTVADAQSLLTGNVGTFVSSSSALGQGMVADSNTLDSYNNSALTPTCTGPK